MPLISNAAGSPENGREKIFLRSWYEPCGQYNGPGEDDTHPTINMEYTYMLMNTLYLPATGTAPNTQFLVPTCEIDTQTGLGAWKSGTNVDNVTTLASVSGIVDPDGTTVRGNITLEKQFTPVVGSNVRFFDHYVELTTVETDDYVIKVGYTGNKLDDAEKGWISIGATDKIYFDRHNNEHTFANHDDPTKPLRTWYVRRNGPLIYVGKELHWGDCVLRRCSKIRCNCSRSA